MAKKEIYHSGHDIKSLLINLATTLLFFLPIGIYFYPEFTREQLIVVGVSSVIAFLAPPVGFYRPHPYSDWKNNKPFAPRIEMTETSIKQS